MKLSQAAAASGLSTDTYKIGSVSGAGTYSIFVRSTVKDPSGIVITLSQSGSQSASFSSPIASGQTNHVEMNASFNCAVGDILSVVVSSSAPVDQPPNLIKSIINLRQGL